jgi:nitrite reductase (NADH) small subunit
MNAMVKDGWIDVCAAEEIPLLGARTLKRGAGVADVALFRGADGTVFALEDRCPHKGGPLSQGIVHGNRVTCPLHNWTIDMANGEAVAPDQGCTQHFAVRVEGGRVLLSVAALDTAHAAPKPPACPISVTRAVA